MEEKALDALRATCEEGEELTKSIAEAVDELQERARNAAIRHATEMSSLRGSLAAAAASATQEEKSVMAARSEARAKEAAMESASAEASAALAAAQRDAEAAMEEERAARERLMATSSRFNELERTAAALEAETAALTAEAEAAESGAASTAATDSDSHAAAQLSDELREVLHQKAIVEVELAEANAAAASRSTRTEAEQSWEAKLRVLAERLIATQAKAEALQTERATLSLRIDAARDALQEEIKHARTLRLEGGGSRRRRRRGAYDDDDDDDDDDDYDDEDDEDDEESAVLAGAGGAIRVAPPKPLDRALTSLLGVEQGQRVGRVVDTVDGALLYFFGVVLRRNSIARALFFTYVALLATWVSFLIFFHHFAGRPKTEMPSHG